MENSLQNQIRTLRVCGNAIWIDQRTSKSTSIDERHVQGILRRIHGHISGDILIYSENTEQHHEHVRMILERIQKIDFLVKSEKCAWDVTEVEFLKHIITTKDIRMDPKKIKVIMEWSTPENIKDVQGFIGLTNYYRKYVNHYSDKAAHLTDMTKGDIGFHWDQKAQEAFDKLKREFREGDFLANFDPELPGIVEADASDRGIGGVYSQVQENGKLRPVAFYSRKLSPAGLNYEIHDKELLAIVECFKQWRVYLEGSKYQVKVYTDHKNLTYFASIQTLNRRQVRWSKELSRYNFLITYRKGE